MKKYLREVLKETVEALTLKEETMVTDVFVDFNEFPTLTRGQDISLISRNMAIIDVKLPNNFHFFNRNQNLQLEIECSIVFIFIEENDEDTPLVPPLFSQEDKADLCPELLVDIIKSDNTLSGKVAGITPLRIEYRPVRNTVIPDKYMSKIDIKVKTGWVSPLLEYE